MCIFDNREQMNTVHKHVLLIIWQKNPLRTELTIIRDNIFNYNNYLILISFLSLRFLGRFPDISWTCPIITLLTLTWSPIWIHLPWVGGHFPWISPILDLWTPSIQVHDDSPCGYTGLSSPLLRRRNLLFRNQRFVKEVEVKYSDSVAIATGYSKVIKVYTLHIPLLPFSLNALFPEIRDKSCCLAPLSKILWQKLLGITCNVKGT